MSLNAPYVSYIRYNKVHDELLFEVRKTRLEEVKVVVRECMENCFELLV